MTTIATKATNPHMRTASVASVAVAELTSSQNGIFCQHQIERRMREIMKCDGEFREAAAGSFASHERGARCIKTIRAAARNTGSGLQFFSRREGCNRQVEAEGERYGHVSEIKSLVSQCLVELCHLPRWKRQECNAFDE
jgi:hypothetical protein